MEYGEVEKLYSHKEARLRAAMAKTLGQADLQLYLEMVSMCLPNQSINQSNFSSVNIPGKARLSGVTAKSVFNCKIEETVP